MNITREQFDSMGIFSLDDIAIDHLNDKLMFEIFKRLPSNIQQLAFQYSLQDTEFKDEAFVYLIKKLFNMTSEEYYKSSLLSLCDYHLFLEPKSLLLKLDS